MKLMLSFKIINSMSMMSESTKKNKIDKIKS